MKVFVVLFIFSFSGVFSDDCKEWFKKTGIQKGPSCLERCMSALTGMDTFACPDECKELCRDGTKAQSNTDKILREVVYYPGLNPDEKQLVQQYPKEAITVFFAKEKAENLASKNFGRNDFDDESDAFRHFLWAALISKELGPDLAKKFLDAHEAGQKSDNPSRAMDLANNRAGLFAADRLKEKNILDVDHIVIEARKALNNNSLVILKKKGGLKN